MDGSLKEIFRVAIGCILALALWKGTREKWFLSLCGLFVIAIMFKYSSADVGVLGGSLVWGAGFLVLSCGKVLFVDKSWKWPKWMRRSHPAQAEIQYKNDV
jgi:hypothetical protein